MKGLFALVTVLALLIVATDPALGQQPTPRPPADAHEHAQQPAPGRPTPPPGQPAPGPHGGGMGGMTGGSMMGGGMGAMMGGMHGGHGGDGPIGLCPTAPMMAHHDAKAMANSLKLCGDLLKAMGDVMLKHAAELEARR